MSKKTIDLVGHTPSRYKPQQRFTIGFVVREACNTNPNNPHGRARSKSITVDAASLSEAINEKNLKRLLDKVRAEFLTKDSRKPSVARIPRAVIPPIPTPYPLLLELRKEKARAQREHEAQRALIEEALAATAAIREETNGHFNHDRRAASVDRQETAARSGSKPPVAPHHPPVAPRRGLVPAGPARPEARVTSATRRDPPPPRPTAPAPFASKAHIARSRKYTALTTPVLHEHTHWCIAPDTNRGTATRPPVAPPVPRRRDNRPTPAVPPRRPGSPEVDRPRCISELAEEYMLPTLRFK